MTRPNVLVIITDQQRADHVGFGGNEVVRTPNLDALAARSTVFDRAYVANPVCSPNRATMLTGRLPSSHGLIFNDRSLYWGANTFARSLRDAGYRTALIGKSHLQVGLGRAVLPPSRRAAATADAFPDEVYGYEYPERYLDGAVDDPDDFYGFGQIELSIEHGARVAGHHLRWALERGGRLDDLDVPMSSEAPARQRSDRWWQIYQPPYEPELHSTNYVAERTVAFVEDAAAAVEPWMAWCSFPDPHHPMTPPGDWYQRHDPADMAVPASFSDPLDNAPEHIRTTRDRAEAPAWVFPFGTDDGVLVQEAIAATYGMIELIDDAVGRIVAAVEATGAAHDTIVVFTSDHGDLMGDHGLMLKGNIHYEGVIRTPLTVHAPGRAAARTSALVSSLDLAPTVLDLCGVPTYAGLQGASLSPLLDDPSGTVRDGLLIEDDAPSWMSRFVGVPTRMRTVVTDRYRYTRDNRGGAQLFDLEADPLELDDLSPDPPRQAAELQTQLLDLMIDLSDGSRGVPRDRAP